MSWEKMMTDRFYALTVALDKDIREDDAQQLIQAIKMMKGVVDVSGEVSDIGNYVSEARVRAELGRKMFEVLYPKS